MTQNQERDTLKKLSRQKVLNNNFYYILSTLAMSDRNLVHHYKVLKQFLDISNDLARSKSNSSRAARAREKLLKLSEAQFKELSTDVYDELRRRIDESRSEPDYLLPKSSFHPKRNQARQKLSSLPQSRFKDLVSDISYEIERRNLHIEQGIKQDVHGANSHSDPTETPENEKSSQEKSVENNIKDSEDNVKEHEDNVKEHGDNVKEHKDNEEDYSKQINSSDIHNQIGIESMTVVPTKANLTWSSDEEEEEENQPEIEHKMLDQLSNPINQVNQDAPQQSDGLSTSKEADGTIQKGDVNSSSDDKQEISLLKEQLRNMESENSALQRKYDLLLEDYDYSVSQNKSLSNEIEDLHDERKTLLTRSETQNPKSIQETAEMEKELDSLRSSIAALRLENQSLKNSNNTSQKDLNHQRSSIKSRSIDNLSVSRSSSISDLRTSVEKFVDKLEDFNSAKLDDQNSIVSIKRNALKWQSRYEDLRANKIYDELNLKMMSTDELKRYVTSDGLISMKLVSKFQSLVETFLKSLDESPLCPDTLIDQMAKISILAGDIAMQNDVSPLNSDHLTVLREAVLYSLTATRYFSSYSSLLPKALVWRSIGEVCFALCDLISVSKLRTSDTDDSIPIPDKSENRSIGNIERNDDFGVRPLKITQKLRDISHGSSPTREQPSLQSIPKRNVSNNKISGGVDRYENNIGTDKGTDKGQPNLLLEYQKTRKVDKPFNKINGSPISQVNNNGIQLRSISEASGSGNVAGFDEENKNINGPKLSPSENKIPAESEADSTTKVSKDILSSISALPENNITSSIVDGASTLIENEDLGSSTQLGETDRKSLQKSIKDKNVFSPFRKMESNIKNKVSTAKDSISNNATNIVGKQQEEDNTNTENTPENTSENIGLNNTDDSISSEQNTSFNNSSFLQKYDAGNGGELQLLSSKSTSPSTSNVKSVLSKLNSKEISLNNKNAPQKRGNIFDRIRKFENSDEKENYEKGSDEKDNKKQSDKKSLDANLNLNSVGSDGNLEQKPNEFNKEDMTTSTPNSEVLNVLEKEPLDSKVDKVSDSKVESKGGFANLVKKISLKRVNYDRNKTDDSKKVGKTLADADSVKPKDNHSEAIQEKVESTFSTNENIADDSSQTSLKSISNVEKSNGKADDKISTPSLKSSSTVKFLGKNDIIVAKNPSSSENIENEGLDSKNNDSVGSSVSHEDNSESRDYSSTNNDGNINGKIPQGAGTEIPFRVIPSKILKDGNNKIESLKNNEFANEKSLGVNNGKELGNDLNTSSNTVIENGSSTDEAVPKKVEVNQRGISNESKDLNNVKSENVKNEPALNNKEVEEGNETDESDYESDGEEDEARRRQEYRKSMAAATFNVDLFDIDDPDNTLTQVLLYLEHQTVQVISTIQSLLSAIKKPNVTRGDLREKSKAITIVISQMTEATNTSMNQTRNAQLKEHGSWVVRSLEDCYHRMDILCKAKSEKKNLDFADKNFKQRLAGISFDIAKCTKELVKTVEEASLKEEIAHLDARITHADDLT